MKKLLRCSGQCQIITAQDADFFKVFWKNRPFYRTFNQGWHKGILSVTQREWVITCIPKDSKPWNQNKNRKPISLLKCIYKTASPVSNTFSFAPELVGYSAPRDLHRRAAYSISESWFLIHQDVYRDLFVCS